MVMHIERQIQFKTSMLKTKSHLCDYGNVYILLSGTITVSNSRPAATLNKLKKT